MEGDFIIIEKWIILGYMLITLISFRFVKNFDSFIFSCLIITLFEVFRTYAGNELLDMLKSGLLDVMPEFERFFHFSWRAIMCLVSIWVIRQGHRMLSIKVGKVAIVYMISALVMIALQIIGYIDSVYFGKTQMVNMFYATGMSFIGLALGVMMSLALIGRFVATK